MAKIELPSLNLTREREPAPPGSTLGDLTPAGGSSPDRAQLELFPAASTQFSPVLLAQLRDDLTRSRLREAFWISVVAHLLAVILLALSPKWLPALRPLNLRSAEEMVRDKEMTYLELPPDAQKPPAKAPDTKYLSDRNRIAKSKVPQPDRELLEKLRRGHPGPPGQAVPQSAPSQPVPQASPGSQQARNTAPPTQVPPQPQTSGNSNFTPPAKPAEPKPNLSAMAGPMSPGSSIAQAARNSRGGFTSGSGGDFGHPGGGGSKVGSGLDILSDTQGVDFGPYLNRVVASVRMNWYNLIPEEARAPLLKRGKVAIEFVILPDGKVGGMRLAGQSGDIALDRAAWGGISASNPFSPLPSEFHGPYLALRFHFYYNPDRHDRLD